MRFRHSQTHRDFLRCPHGKNGKFCCPANWAANSARTSMNFGHSLQLGAIPLLACWLEKSKGKPELKLSRACNNNMINDVKSANGCRPTTRSPRGQNKGIMGRQFVYLELLELSTAHMTKNDAISATWQKAICPPKRALTVLARVFLISLIANKNLTDKQRNDTLQVIT